jgi:SSS family solute:Na+ symporter
MKRLAAICVVLLMAIRVTSAEPPSKEKESLLALQQAVLSPSFWVKVHGIEFFADLGYYKEALQYTDEHLASFDSIPQKRIGFWRCKYKLSPTAIDRKTWLDKIKGAYLDTTGPDRLHAVETLAKLGFSLRHFDGGIVDKDLKGEPNMAAFTYWGYVLPKYDGARADFDMLFTMFDNENAAFRKIGAYSLGFIPQFPEEKWPMLVKYALKEPSDSPAYPYMLSAAYMAIRSKNNQTLQSEIRQRLQQLKDVQDKSARIELCRALAVNGIKSDMPLLQELLQATNPLPAVPGKMSQAEADIANEDVRAAAAFAILCLNKKYK